ncbi:Hypp4791 [Branchiostoma lanceolatum]|uniref:Hypp4791 protein n=1 Tax=Branchiostoma lanceolatum TaxID=7740 RepID=A0A8K0F2U3_BRALA|nr:Hypp4791 [Branchiostoma lanceolatum]
MFRIACQRLSTVFKVNKLKASASFATKNGSDPNGRTFLNDYSLLAYYFAIRASIFERTKLTQREVRGIVDRSGFFSFAMTADQVRMFTSNEPFEYAEVIISDLMEDLKDAGNSGVDIMKDNFREMPFRLSKEAKECLELGFDLYLYPVEIVKFNDLLERYRPSRDKEETYYAVVPLSPNIDELFKPDVSKRDFTPKNSEGFYVTKLISVAKRWALELEEVFGKYQVAVVAHTLPPGWRDSFNGKVFRDGKFVEWQRFVTRAHAGRNDHHYDFVEGPFLNTMMLPDYIEEGDYIDEPDEFEVVPAGHQLAVFHPGLLNLFLDTVTACEDP